MDLRAANISSLSDPRLTPFVLEQQVPADAAVIEARDVFKVFIGGGDRHSRRAFLALRDVNLLVEAGQFVSFVGPYRRSPSGGGVLKVLLRAVAVPHRAVQPEDAFYVSYGLRVRNNRLWKSSKTR